MFYIVLVWPVCDAFNAQKGKKAYHSDHDRKLILEAIRYVDEEKETVAELLLIDDDTILVNDELLKGLDKELDDFLKDLLEK